MDRRLSTYTPGATIRAVRKLLKWSQPRIARETGWSRPSYDRWEREVILAPPGLRLVLLGLITREQVWVPREVLEELRRPIVAPPETLELTP